jgi:hypothetical protein
MRGWMENLGIKDDRVCQVLNTNVMTTSLGDNLSPKMSPIWTDLLMGIIPLYTMIDLHTHSTY